jgi:ABC-2 type transport system permease protein
MDIAVREKRNLMRNIWTIAKREYDNYFNSPLAYAIAVGMFFILGIYFSIILYVVSEQAMMGGGVPETKWITDLFAFLMVLISPALTMRLIADEARAGTLELLLTAPVRDFELVAGKWLGVFLFVLSMTLMTLIYPLFFSNMVTPNIDWWAVASSYLGLVLLFAAALALGTGISAIFTNQFVAFFVTLMTMLFLWFIIGFPANYLPEGGEVFKYLSLSEHFNQSMNNGTINLSDIVYYLSLAALGLFAGTTAVEIRRWN